MASPAPPPPSSDIHVRFCGVQRILDVEHQPQSPSKPCVFRSFSGNGTTVLRTFLRDPGNQRLKAKSWVYVLSDHKTANQYRLEYILYFHAPGVFRYVDLAKPTEIPMPVGKNDDGLSLLELPQAVAVPDKETRRVLHYCALLSPEPMSHDFVDALDNPTTKEHKLIVAHALVRGSWINDPFTCDFVAATKPKPPNQDEVKALAKDFLEDKDVPKGERILYLINPCSEAIPRILAYNELAQSALALQIQNGQNPRYVLVKRIQAIIAGDENLRGMVPKLGFDLQEFENPVGALWFQAEEECRRLLRWCGYGFTAEGWTWLSGGFNRDQITFDATQSWPPKPYEKELRPEQKIKSNWLSGMMYEARYGSDQWKKAVGAVRNLFISRLDQTKSGREFLKMVTDQCLGEAELKPIEEDGLIGALAATMKPADFVLQGWDGLLQNLLPWWYMRKGNMTFASLADFVKSKSGIDINVKEAVADRAKVDGLKAKYRAEYETRLQKAKKLVPAGKGSNEVFETDASKAIVKAAKVGQALARAATFWEKFGEAKKKGDHKAVMEAMSSGLNALELTFDLMPKPWEKLGEAVERTTQYSYKVTSQAGVRVAKLKFLGSIASGIDLVLALEDLGNSRGAGTGLGYALNAVGAAFGLIGALAAETGIGVGLALVGMVLQWVGAYVVEHMDELNVYLRTSPWGKDTGPKVTFKGNPATEVTSLMEKLDEILYGFGEPKVRLEFDKQTGAQQFLVDVSPPRATPLLPADAVFLADMDISNEYTREKCGSHAHWEMTTPYLTSLSPWTVLGGALTKEQAAGFSFHLSGRFVLRLSKDGSRVVQRGLSYSTAGTPDYANRPSGTGGSL